MKVAVVEFCFIQRAPCLVPRHNCISHYIYRAPRWRGPTIWPLAKIFSVVWELGWCTRFGSSLCLWESSGMGIGGKKLGL